MPRAFVRPAQRFMQVEAAGGMVMLVAAVVALVWANSPWRAGYESLWETPLVLGLGSLLQVDLPLREWINEGAMALFFFVVGLEIKRELVAGELRNPRAAALPAIAALGGMVVPALIYIAFNAGGPGAHGWGIPMATDIAFAVGVVSLLGSRVPAGARLFLLTLAIVDDLGAILVIALFYAGDVSLGWLAIAVALTVATVGLRRADVRSLVPYLALGVACWLALHESGVHATMAGVAFGFLTPAWSFYDPARFGSRASRLVEGIERSFHDRVFEAGEHERSDARLADLVRLASETQSPLDRLVSRLNVWVSFVVIPVFALANAGVRLTADELSGALGDRVVLGVAFGLVVGKTVGIFGATWLAIRLRMANLPSGASWRHMLGVAACAGIGFTVALFVAGLAFETEVLTASAKLGVLAGSLVAGVLGFALLRACPPAGSSVAGAAAGGGSRQAEPGVAEAEAV